MPHDLQQIMLGSSRPTWRAIVGTKPKWLPLPLPITDPPACALLNEASKPYLPVCRLPQSAYPGMIAMACAHGILASCEKEMETAVHATARAMRH